MKNKFLLLVAAILVMTMLAGCAGTVVVVGNCTCPTEGHTVNTPTESTQPSVGDGETALKTGLAVSTKISDSVSATADKAGAAAYDITIAAVTVDDNGVIRSCKVDSVPATVNFGTDGVITTDLATVIDTKNEKGENYGMVAWGGAIAEWDAQVAALCNFAVGKTVAELKSGAVSESGYAPEGTDLASSATIYLGGYVAVIEAAVNNAQHLGAIDGDELKLVTLNSIASSASATADKAGTAQLDANIAVVTVREGVVSSCIIDAVQGKISFDATGAITTDLTAPVQTKNELGEGYGMKAWGGATYEWNEQAASFAAYVTGKTAAEVAGIAVTEGKPSDADLAASVTIAIGDFQGLIAKALG